MHSHPWDADDPARPHRHDANDAGDNTNRNFPTPSDDELVAIPAPLRNWQVIEPQTPPETAPGIAYDTAQPREIDGEATVIYDAEVAGGGVSAPSPVPTLPDDVVDDVVVAGLAATRVQARPGETATLTVNLFNNGRWPSLFEVTLEGWIDERWCPDLPMRVHLQPGERQTVAVALTPPAPWGGNPLDAPTAAAGAHAAVLAVHAARYPGRATRLAVTLDIAPHIDIQLGAPQPRHAHTTWLRRSALVHVPLANQGNTPATVHLSARARDYDCDFLFYTDAPSVTGVTPAQLGRGQVTLAPGAATSVAVEIRPHSRPIFGLTAASLPFRVTAQPLAPSATRRSVDGRLSVVPLIGLWQLVAATVVGVALLFGVGLAGLALLMALRSTSAQVAPAPVAAPAAPVVAFVIQLGEPAPTRMSPAAATASGAAPPITAPTPLGGVPVVSADQVSAPDEPVPAGQPRLQPIPATPTPALASAAARPLTYAEMFQEVALRFDLNWRMLAAQAYVESGFDAVALGSRGDMGLMQILPGTWREWAPTVQAADPFDSYNNVLVAAAYLDHLRTQLASRGYPQQEWMLVAYNWGPDQVFDYLAAGGSWEALSPERRQYAEEILRIAESIPAN